MELSLAMAVCATQHGASTGAGNLVLTGRDALERQRGGGGRRGEGAGAT